jgi:hypothetical protein
MKFQKKTFAFEKSNDYVNPVCDISSDRVYDIWCRAAWDMHIMLLPAFPICWIQLSKKLIIWTDRDFLALFNSGTDKGSNTI